MLLKYNYYNFVNIIFDLAMRDFYQNKIIEITLELFPIGLKSLIQPLRNKLGLSPIMHIVMNMIEKDEGMTMGEISNKLFMPKPNVTEVINKLIKSGYAERIKDEKDRRLVKVKLTKSGIKVLKLIKLCVSKQVSSKLRILSEAELIQIYQSLNKVNELINEITTN